LAPFSDILLQGNALAGECGSKELKRAWHRDPVILRNPAGFQNSQTENQRKNHDDGRLKNTP